MCVEQLGIKKQQEHQNKTEKKKQTRLIIR